LKTREEKKASLEGRRGGSRRGKKLETKDLEERKKKGLTPAPTDPGKTGGPKGRKKMRNGRVKRGRKEEAR